AIDQQARVPIGFCARPGPILRAQKDTLAIHNDAFGVARAIKLDTSLVESELNRPPENIPLLAVAASKDDPYIQALLLPIEQSVEQAAIMLRDVVFVILDVERLIDEQDTAGGILDQRRHHLWIVVGGQDRLDFDGSVQHLGREWRVVLDAPRRF